MSSCVNWELADAGLGLAEEVAVEEDGVEDSSLGELSFFMKGRKKYRPALLDSDHSSTIAFRFTWSNFENCIAALAASMWFCITVG